RVREGAKRGRVRKGRGAAIAYPLPCKRGRAGVGARIRFPGCCGCPGPPCWPRGDCPIGYGGRAMAANRARRVGVIGAGMVGVCAATFLQRDGHSVYLIEPGNPGEGASFGNAGCFNGSSVTPVAMPGVIRSVPRWLMDPLGPLALRWSYLPAILPYLIRFARSATPEKVRAQA